MRIVGMNKRVCKGLWVVYTVNNRTKYFFGAYRFKNKAQEVAAKYQGNYILIY
jgi:hypothetical protein